MSKESIELMLARAIDNKNREEVLYWSNMLSKSSVRELVVKMEEFKKTPVCKLLFSKS